MVNNAEELKASLMANNELKGPAFKMREDPRLTPIGKFLRKTSLDELPQLINIFKGEMCFVGPRPMLASEVKEFEPWMYRRFEVKPGITCIWQIAGRNKIKTFKNWMNMDIDYIDNWNLWLDIKILLITVPVVLFGYGAE
jgi:lipopolysaccharide/colanic/teichoic acid biosynthesis glycosyltransferase